MTAEQACELEIAEIGVELANRAYEADMTAYRLWRVDYHISNVERANRRLREIRQSFGLDC